MSEIVSGLLLRIRSSVLPSWWVGLLTNWHKFLLKTRLQIPMESLFDAVKVAQFISGVLKSPTISRLQVESLCNCVAQ